MIRLSERKIFVQLTLIFGYTNQKIMRVEATKFLVSTTKILVGATKFFWPVLSNLIVLTKKLVTLLV